MHATQPWRTAAVALLFVLAVAATPTRAEDEEAARSSELAPADTYVGALFDDLKGVHRFDDSGSQQITLWRAESVTAVDLATASQTWRLRRARRCPIPASDRSKESYRRLVGRASLVSRAR